MSSEPQDGQHPSVSEPRTTATAPDPYEDGPISDTEHLSRFIFDQGGFSSSTKRINFRQFLPPKKGKHTEEVSVMRTESLAEDVVWTLGQETAATPSGRCVRARGDFESAATKKAALANWRLDVQPSVPPPRCEF